MTKRNKRGVSMIIFLTCAAVICAGGLLASCKSASDEPEAEAISEETRSEETQPDTSAAAETDPLETFPSEDDFLSANDPQYQELLNEIEGIWLTANSVWEIHRFEGETEELFQPLHDDDGHITEYRYSSSRQLVGIARIDLHSYQGWRFYYSEGGFYFLSDDDPDHFWDLFIGSDGRLNQYYGGTLERISADEEDVFGIRDAWRASQS